MKKLISLLLAIVMICSVVPMTAFARNAYIFYAPTDGCQMTAISFTQADNPWLLWDVTFANADSDVILKTVKDHPGLVGAEVIPSIDFVGTSVTFNGETIVEGETIKLKAENELVVRDDANHNFAEYTIIVTEKSNGLPVVLVDTVDDVDPADMTKLEYTDANISVIGSDIYDAKDIYYAVAGIKLRGNSTMGYAKKPFRIKFDKKQNVLGFGKAKSWVLLADYLDPSALRNQVAYKLADRVNKFTAEKTGFEVFSPRMNLVEVYVDDEFMGMYEMGDHMQANELRVNVNELGDEEDDETGEKLYNNGEEIGYFIEVEVKDRVLKEGKDGYEDWSDYSYVVDVLPEGQWYPQKVDDKDTENNYVIREDDMGKSVMYFQFKLPEEPSDEQKEYITEQMQQVNDLLMKNDEAVWDILDMDSVIDWYLVNELFKNADSQMQSSVYFFKDGTLDADGNEKENPNTKLYMGPVWDFDLGAGGVSYGEMDDPTGWRTRNDEYCAWFKKMFEMDSFKNAVEKRWADLHEEGILDALFTDITSLEELAGDAAVDNFKLWHDSYVTEANNTSWMTIPAVSAGSDNWTTHVDYFEAYLKARIDWMDEQFGYADETVLGTVIEEANFFENEVFTAASSGKPKHTYTVDKLVDLDMLAFKLNINSSAKFDFGFDLTVSTNANANKATIHLTPSARNDWQAGGSSNPFVGSTGAYIAAGTYTDRVMTVTGAIKWNLWANYESNMRALGYTNYGSIDLSKIVTKVRLNSVYVQFENASVGDTATFTLQNVDEDGNPMMVEKTIIAGKPTVMGEAFVGNTLFVSNTEILPGGASVAYQWYKDGKPISAAAENSYTLTDSDLGKSITVKAHGIAGFSGIVTSDPMIVGKKQRSSEFTSASIVVNDVSADSITVTTAQNNDNVEFSLDGKTWQTAKTVTFSDLKANTLYTIYLRAAEHGSGTAGVTSDPLYVITKTGETFKGDINGSGALDTTDAVWVLDHALDFSVMTNETVLDLSDINSDGKINTLDARLILKEIVNSPVI